MGYLNNSGLTTFSKKIKTWVKEQIAAVQNALNPMVSITYADLKALRDGSKLVAGRRYRITDFVTTSVQTDTRSAGHAFDVIVKADDVNVLNENAKAIQHKGDTYFSGCKLSAWELKYCLDNDTNRFAWADTTNGKGVVWWMKDEWDNECFYDFKNIQYKRYKVTGVTDTARHSSFLNGYYGIEGGFQGVKVSDTDFKWAYTFSVLDVDRDTEETQWDADYPDASVLQGGSNDPDGGGYMHPILRCEKNRVDALEIASIVDDLETTVKYALNDGVFFSKYKWPETDDGTYRHELEHCAYNRFGNSHGFTLEVCCVNKTGTGCYEFLCGNNCSSWTCGNNCSSWTCGNNCYSWTCGNNCYYNSFGDNCYNNSFGNNCYNNSFGNSCRSNSFGNFCYSNSFGNNCNNNSFGNECFSNSFGNSCYNNSFGNECFFNSFGNFCYNNSFGNSCYNNSFGNGTIVDAQFDNIQYIHVDNGVRYVQLLFNEQATKPSSSAPLQNLTIKSGIKGTDISKKLTIDCSSIALGADYEWIIAKNSNGEIKQYCEADLIN